MLTPSHIAASYIVSQIPTFFGMPLRLEEVLAVIVAGNIIDLDFLVGLVFKKKNDDHHNFLTHTPIFTTFVWIICLIFFSSFFSSTAWIFIFISALLHFVLDDIGYWFYLIGWQKISSYPQIHWFYPLRAFPVRKSSRKNRDFLHYYWHNAPVNVIVECILVVTALLVLLLQIA